MTEPTLTVLIVDDEAKVRRSIAEFLDDEGYSILEAETTAEAESVLDDQGAGVDLVLLDVRMPGEEGVAFLERRPDLPAVVPVIVMSGHGTIELAVEAVQKGAFDFLEKGFTPERLLLTVRRALEVRNLARRHAELKEGFEALHRLVGTSRAMEELRATIQRAAPTPAKVLLLGENGVGKELVARAIHDLSPRADAAFVRLNCAAIPRELVESELFGHEKGSFTGADAQKKGKLELAHGGTLFLDEIGDMDLDAQAKLLRALEANEFERVGGTKTLTVDVRLIAATNKDLEAEVEAGRFRRDLFYRLNVLPVRVPPLRDRQGDIEVLVEHYLDYFRAEYGRPKLALDGPAVERLARYRWPGNVRELRNLVERLVIMSPGDRVGATQVEGLLGTGGGVPAAAMAGDLAVTLEETDEGLLRAAVEGAERAIIERELASAGGNVSAAARVLGIDRGNLHKKMKKLGIER